MCVIVCEKVLLHNLRFQLQVDPIDTDAHHEAGYVIGLNVNTSKTKMMRLVLATEHIAHNPGRGCLGNG